MTFAYYSLSCANYSDINNETKIIHEHTRITVR